MMKEKRWGEVHSNGEFVFIKNFLAGKKNPSTRKIDRTSSFWHSNCGKKKISWSIDN